MDQGREEVFAADGTRIPAWWEPDPGAVYDVNPICGCHIRSRCSGCGCCQNCEGCYCNED